MAKTPKFDTVKAKASQATFHETKKFSAVTIPGDRFERLIRIVRNGKVWNHKNFQV